MKKYGKLKSEKSRHVETVPHEKNNLTNFPTSLRSTKDPRDPCATAPAALAVLILASVSKEAIARDARPGWPIFFRAARPYAFNFVSIGAQRRETSSARSTGRLEQRACTALCNRVIETGRGCHFPPRPASGKRSRFHRGR